MTTSLPTAYYRYVKKTPRVVEFEAERIKTPTKLMNIKRLAAPIMVSVGSLMLLSVLWPIVHYQLAIAPQIQKVEFASPVPTGYLGNTPLAVGPTVIKPQDVTQVMGVMNDLTKASSWFPEANYGIPGRTQELYHLNIPTLKIEEARVIVNGDDLNKGLIHYPGTALPGQLGSPVIFGHSVLRQFYDPRKDNPQRYVSIFSKIMTLKNGDKITIDFDGVRYTYEVKEKLEVKPEDVFILEQKYTNKELKLITCVPEGTYLRRGVVIAQLMDIE